MVDDSPPWPRASNPPPQHDGSFPLVEHLWALRRVLAAAGFGGAVLAGTLSYLMPRQYTSTATFVPEESSAGNVPAGLGALAGQFGFALGNGGGQSPEFYIRLLRSQSVGTAVVTADYDGRTLVDYFETGGRPDSVERARRKLSGAVSGSVDAPTRIVRLDVELSTPALAQAVARRFLVQLETFNNDIRRSRASERRRFADEQFALTRDSLTVAEDALRDFVSRNRQSGTPELQYERERLQRAVQAAQEVYTSLLRELQQARIDEVDDTPRFSVIDAPSLPYRKSSPSRFVMALFGGVLTAGVVGLVALWKPGWLPMDPGWAAR